MENEQGPRRLVVIGDSLSHGFKSGAIHDTGLSWPAQVARAMGLTKEEFRIPAYDGPDECPGLPLNLEALLRDLEGAAGEHPLVGARAPVVAAHAISVLRSVKSYWERGPGAAPPTGGGYMDNQSIYGWDICDALHKSYAWCRDNIDKPSTLGIFGHGAQPLHVTDDGNRAALRVLVGPDGPGGTQVSNAQAIAQRHGIETLFVALGANNALSSVLKVALRWTPDDYLDWPTARRLECKDHYTVWRPEHFISEYAELVSEVKKLNAAHVVLATVPHVTIAPLLHGFGEKPAGSRYFPRYGRVWMTDAEFDPNRDPCLTGDECRQIDAAIDEYNAEIKAQVESAQGGGLDWQLFDVCGLLDGLAYRRYLADPLVVERPAQYPFPPALAAMSPRPDTRFFGSDRFGRTQGGLIALDGIHPTTIGYGIMAVEALKIMQAIGTVRADVDIDFAALLQEDSLVGPDAAPLASFTNDLEVLGFLQEHLDIFKSVIGT